MSLDHLGGLHANAAPATMPQTIRYDVALPALGYSQPYFAGPVTDATHPTNSYGEGPSPRAMPPRPDASPDKRFPAADPPPRGWRERGEANRASRSLIRFGPCADDGSPIPESAQYLGSPSL